MLADLDELVLTCPDPRSRAYIKEAVICYKAGAYRASVVACWIAVAFDLVDKLRELSAAGDKEAQIQIAEFERIQKDNDISAALKFEKELPGIALHKFELVSHIEHSDLIRLVEDRNRCAHPSQVLDDQVFEASAELARLHISNSIRSILSQEVTQGKGALDRIMQDMSSRYFPAKRNDVFTFLSNGPLGRPRKSLYRNFLQVMLKTLCTKEASRSRTVRCRHAVVAVKRMHPQLWEEMFADVLNGVVSGVKADEDLAVVCTFAIHPKDIGVWESLKDIQRMRVSNFVMQAPSDCLGLFDDLLDLPAEHELSKAAVVRLRRSTFQELKSVTWAILMPESAMDRLVKLYSASESYGEANEIGRFLKSSIPEAIGNHKHVENVVKAAAKNDQVRGSNELDQVLRVFSKQPEVGIERVRECLKANGVRIEGI